MHQFGYDHDTVILTGELSMSSVSILIINQIFVGKERYFWPGLDNNGVSSLAGVLFLYKCLGLMNTFVKHDAGGPSHGVYQAKRSFHVS